MGHGSGLVAEQSGEFRSEGLDRVNTPGAGGPAGALVVMILVFVTLAFVTLVFMTLVFMTLVFMTLVFMTLGNASVPDCPSEHATKQLAVPAQESRPKDERRQERGGFDITDGSLSNAVFDHCLPDRICSYFCTLSIGVNPVGCVCSFVAVPRGFSEVEPMALGGLE